MSGSEALAYPPDDPPSIDALAVRSARLASWVDELAGHLARDAQRLAGAWEGPAGRACRAELVQVARLTGSLTGPLHVADRLLRANAAHLTEARRQVDALRVQYDGQVAAHRREMTALPDVPAPVRALRAQDCDVAQATELARLEARHREVLHDIAAHAQKTSRQVLAAVRAVVPRQPLAGRPVTDLEADIASLLPLLAASRRQAGVPSGLPSPGTAPARVRGWWAALTTDEQHRLVDRLPRQLGVLDGLPAQARSNANGQVLDRDITALLALGVRTEGQQRRLDTCLAVRERLRHLRARRDPLTGRPLTVQLLVFEPAAFDGDGRVAVGIGDVGTADHVAVLVPGMGATVRADIGALTDDALRVRTLSRRRSSAARTATVAWLGYDAPGLPSAVSDAAAERGSDLLAADLRGLQAARDSLPHLTVVGHSYGSTTAGTSLRDHRTGVDDVVLLGSPGANVERAAELRVPSGHVFVGSSSRDPVSYLDHFGADPTHRAFGALRFQAEDLTRNPWMLDFADHSKYYAPRTESLSNVVRVVVGDYDSVRPAAYRGEAWLRPDGIGTDPEADRAPTAAGDAGPDDET